MAKMIKRFCVVGFAAIIAGWLWIDQATAQAPVPAPLQFERKILLGDVNGRIDHLAIDLARKRLFVAELGNDSVAVVDLDEGAVRHVISGLKEPQGLGYVAASDTLFVANAGDGSVRLFRGESYAASGRIDLGEDADNIRVDAAANRVFVGYGNGGLAVIDPATNGKIADISLPVHPESFQLSRSERRVFVNLPKARAIGIVDRFASKQTASWMIETGSNFPMALDENSGRVLVVSRNPAQLSALAIRDGSPIATIDRRYLRRCKTSARVHQLWRRRVGCARAGRKVLSSAGAHADHRGSTDLTVRPRDRSTFCRGARQPRRTGGYLDISSGPINLVTPIYGAAIMPSARKYCRLWRRWPIAGPTARSRIASRLIFMDPMPYR